MILMTSNTDGDLAMEIHQATVRYGSGMTAAVVFELEDASTFKKKRFEDIIEFRMELEDVKQLHAWLGCLLKSDWAKQKH
jgi:glutamate synthase domain-containing protein 3